MSKEMNERLQQIKEREEKVIAADWMIVPVLEHASVIHAGDYSSEGEPDLIIEVCSATHKDDAEFIAHARSDIPWLLTQLAAILEENQRLAKELKESQDAHEAEGQAWIAMNEAAEAKLEKMREALNTIPHQTLCRIYSGVDELREQGCNCFKSVVLAALAE